ncbi:substrate-binding periplasmic protein [Vibrio bivalvicida]|uniref:Amino acid ABC transporter n=1 Tax=Vibrio bivalvicida TaxID=1276888 RepID=A0A177XYZ1_9VIBR|nr:transporter substrate-binding domain-containing protein [Vibrio bivalvicida]OAJ93823.1 amino acid ABC transporter [Vibrio bivalvicida]
MSKLTLSILLLSFSILCSAHANERVVRLVVGDWEPYTSSQNNPNYKISETLVKAAYATQGYEVQIDYHPWTRAYRYAQTDRYDGTFPWFKNSEREELFLFSSPLFVQKIVFFYHMNSRFAWQDIADLNNFRIGATQEYEVTRLMQSNGIELEVSNSDDVNFIKLGKYRIDAYPAGLERGYYMMGNILPAIQINQLKVHPKPIIENDMFVMFSKQNIKRSKRLSEALRIGIESLIESGEYQVIIDVEKQIRPEFP